MPNDPTEATRRELLPLVNEVPVTLLPPPTWTTDKAREAFTFHAFMAPLVVVTEKATGKKGTLMFQHSPRVYFGFEPDQP